MIDLLLATSLSCSDGAWILQGVKRSNLTKQESTELKLEILKNMPDDCSDNDYKGVLE